MPDLMHTLTAAAPWAGLTLLGLIFMANALGVLDQSAAARELAAAGAPEAAARWMVAAGRLVQLIATPCLFVHALRPYAAVLLASSSSAPRWPPTHSGATPRESGQASGTASWRTS